MNLVRILSIFIMVLGLVAIVVGGVFVGEGLAKNSLITERMNVEKVSIALDPNHPDVVTQVNNATEAQQAADKIAADRRNIAPTYQDLLAQSGGRFDPTNAKELSYAQAMNLENYLYLAVAAFGLVQVTLASGAFMIITGLALGGAGFAIWRLGRG
jgi:hypothetical protein